MILLTPPFSENFDDRDKRSTSTAMMNLKQARDCFDVSLNDDCVKMYNDEYIEVFSPTVFETVEVYTSSSSDRSDYTNFGDATNNVLSAESEVNVDSALSLDTLDAVTSFEHLEPGTYTLDVIQPTDFDFDAVFAENSSTTSPNNIDQPSRVEDSIQENALVAEYSKTTVLPKKPKGGDEGTKRPYRLKSCNKNSSRKLPSPKYATQITRNVTAREFLNNFSNDLRRTEESTPKKPPVAEDEGRSLSWLLNFQISSIFNPVESDIVDAPEKVRKKGHNDSQKKPRYTYTELIEQALKENGELTVSGIYSWISNHYPYYQQHDDRWKNSVRHNLSINPQFRKGKKASQGAGHFWNISDMLSQSSELNNNSNNNNNNNNNAHGAIINAHKIDALPRVSAESVSHRNKDTIPDSVTEFIDQIDEEVLAATKSIQDSESMNFTDVSLHDAVAQHSASSIHISRNDIEQLWESTNENVDHRFSSFSPLIREITEESSNMEEENFLIEDIHNSICLGDELFSSELTSSYYGLTTL